LTWRRSNGRFGSCGGEQRQAVPRASGEDTELEAKQVKIGERRYIVCRNLAEARRDAEQREAILSGLRAKLAQGDKALVGNNGFRHYLKTVSAEHFATDEVRVAEDARFDGLYVLRTNTKITPLQVMLALPRPEPDPRGILPYPIDYSRKINPRVGVRIGADRDPAPDANPQSSLIS
jgi:hypothetical protein